jgi:hypothetical protein
LKNINFSGSWAAGEVRENKIIFIGRGMKARRQELTEAFNSCVVTEPLRFKIGSQVQARTGQDDYENGHIVGVWDEYNAYRIRLLSGDEVHAPCDDDRFLRVAP